MSFLQLYFVACYILEMLKFWETHRHTNTFAEIFLIRLLYALSANAHTVLFAIHLLSSKIKLTVYAWKDMELQLD